MPENEHEKSARLAKATKFADLLACRGKLTSEEIERSITEEPDLYEQMWIGATAFLNAKAQTEHELEPRSDRPTIIGLPSEATRKLVIQLIKNREQADREARWRYSRKHV